MEQNARVILNRKNEWVNRARSLKVFVDGVQAGAIKNGQSEEFHISEGKHTISCKVDWCSSREFEFDLAAGQTLTLRVQSGMRYYWQIIIPFVIVMLINLFMILGKRERPELINTLILLTALPVIIYMLYYTVIKRKDYLKISKDDSGMFR